MHKQTVRHKREYGEGEHRKENPEIERHVQRVWHRQRVASVLIVEGNRLQEDDRWNYKVDKLTLIYCESTFKCESDGVGGDPEIVSQPRHRF